jgi:hypothetical protein
VIGGLALGAALQGALAACALLGAAALTLVLRSIQECAVGTAGFLKAIRKIEQAEKVPEKSKDNEQLAA